ncbi:LacI family DNA-binding transcriptional regulator [Pseudomonas sp. SWRI107]|uniref:LacI family DNA-binding transcriptional regulator n=1 Tax=Pseudomonas farsensis TaxID=2745492 RepID=UPI00164452C4|nr:LacI family DNA-binding transcriptional regulator [Pseudomonas farsensis]
MDKTDRRQGMADVAQQAGVSLSTVDRVLNERGSVSDSKRRKVLQAAQALGLKRLLPSAVHGLLRFDLLLVDSATDHFRRLAVAFAKQAQMHRSRLVLQRSTWQERAAQQLPELISQPRVPRQGLIVVAQDTPQVREALQAQMAAGVPVVLLTSSLPGMPGATYVGIDNHAAGRAAGRLMSQWIGPGQGAVLLVTNSLLYHAHQLRVKGFLEVMAERAPQVPVIGPIECFDDDDLNASKISDFLSRPHGVCGLYTTGSGSTGVHRALLGGSRQPVWISHEATAQHAGMLREGVLSLVLDQDPEGQAEAAIQHLLYANGDLDAPPQVKPQLRIVIDETLEGSAF